MYVFVANVGDRVRALSSEEWTRAVFRGAQPTSIRDQSWLADVWLADVMAGIFQNPGLVGLLLDYLGSERVSSERREFRISGPSERGGICRGKFTDLTAAW
jgi:hypothetical protein